MRSWIINPLVFDGAKFAARYGLNSFAGDFSLNGNVLTVKPDAKVTDDPPIIETPNPPKPAVATRLDAAKTLPDLIAVLKDVLR